MAADNTIRQQAHRLAREHGEDAPIQAATRAQALHDQGDLAGGALWERTGNLTNVLLSKTAHAATVAPMGWDTALIQSSLDILDQGITVFDADLKLVFANHKFLELRDLPPNLGKVGTRFEEQIRFRAERGDYGPGDLEDLVQKHVEMAKKFEAHRVERTQLDGRVLEIRGDPLSGGGFIATYTNITDRKRAEEALREREEQYRTLLVGSIQGVLIHRNDKPLFANQALADSFGYDSPEEILALSSIGELKAKHDRERLKDYSLARLRNESAPVRYEFEGLRKDGTPIWLENFITVATWNGEPAIQSTTINITDRKRAEEALKASEQELMERLLELEQSYHAYEVQGADLVQQIENLSIAHQQLHCANLAQSQFLANVSHELRTPLSAITGFSEMIKDEIMGPVGNTKYRDYAGDIYESGQHLLDLINDILDLSKIESGKDELHEDKIEIPEIIRSVLKLVGQRAEQGGIKLELELSDQLPALRADKRKLKQILINLLSNAIKFTDAGGRVTLKAWCRGDSGHVFQVIDTGIGMRLEDIPRALAPFEQVDNDLNRKFEGTGLGLPLTKALAELHGGTFDLQSQLGSGTTATVRFPAERIVRSPRDTKAVGAADRKAS